MLAFITTEEYATWVTCALDDLPSDMARLILRASELIYQKTFMCWTLPSATADVPQAVKDATCAQIEFWLEEVGEGYDRVTERGGGTVNFRGLVMTNLPPTLAPRACRFLKYGGYFNRVVQPKGLGIPHTLLEEETN